MMSNFYLKSTPKTPYINFEGDTGDFRLAGRSIPENSIEYYRPLMEWLESYIDHPAKEINIEARFEYFNTSSSKCLVEMFRLFERIHKDGKSSVYMKWYYEEDDEDMMDSGEDFSLIFGFPVEIIQDTEV
ncbi:DUF1987 domain-containing protein [Aureibacter tunicatorum]|uniref:SiaC family regulatory phosphoprotein domain-containing protein n=1 Tax=Aureibacter tunicatorum TaxID=866807 RepID=A0AAE3XPZ2_9BACT|nr:DUF1987 domain-containing protein [Aureibacter tunicatorum]MDR6239910.1 hypothetical protein [Aureibacter tunicatorum]BDD04385.1 hypothetical protein AUTU_18680 [Aureibacter tunicatorum]